MVWAVGGWQREDPELGRRSCPPRNGAGQAGRHGQRPKGSGPSASTSRSEHRAVWEPVSADQPYLALASFRAFRRLAYSYAYC